MDFDIITIFPHFFESFLKESLIRQAIENDLIKINIHNLRNFTDDPHQVIDDRPFGGGFGMVFKIEPIYRAVKEINRGRAKVILFTPRGKQLTQRKITDYSKHGQIIMICARYEGVDERVAKHIAHEEVSIGDYVLLGGEVPAMVVMEATSRLIPGVIGDPEILKERVTAKGDFKEYMQYTRPQIFQTEKGEKWEAPEVLLSGDHKKIEEWRASHSRDIGAKG